MLSYLKGAIIAKRERYLIVAVDDKIGYRVYVTSHVLDETNFNQQVALYISTYVREDTLDLYGFPTIEELDFFETLISISGVGPRSGLGVMSIASLSDIKKAIIHGDPELLQKVTSIGKKTSERIIVELKEKITVSEKDDPTGGSITENVQLLEALSSLGYKDAEIRIAIKKLSPETKKLADKIKEALQLLSNRGS